MKKFLSLLLSALCVSGMALTTSAGLPTYEEQRYIPRAATAPTIDGVITDDEWNNALAIELNDDNTENQYWSSNTCPNSTFYFMWSEEGLYFFGDVADETDSAIKWHEGAGHYNSGDGIQLCIYPNIEDIGNDFGKLYCWTLVVANTGKAEVGEHFVYGAGDEIGLDVEEVVAACTKTETAYTFEAFFPATLFTKSETPLNFKTGTTFALTNFIMEMNRWDQSLFIDSAFFHAPASNKYTLTDELAGSEGGEVDPPVVNPPVEPGDEIPGDITGDGVLALADALLLFQHSMMPDVYKVDYTGDMDFTRDGVLTVADALRLFQHSMMPDVYPLFAPAEVE